MTGHLAQHENVRHRAVMLTEVMHHLQPRDGGLYVDGTFGAGGYARAILGGADTRVYAIDRDPDAVRAAAALVAEYAGRLVVIEGRFSQMRQLLAVRSVNAVDGVVLDLGVSSMQLKAPERGFSFMIDGPLDMRMDREGPTAAEVINTLPERELARIIAVLGEERRARSIARAIAKARARQPIVRTRELAALVERVVGRPQAGGIHPATRTFQALRIHVNDELGELERALDAAEVLLRTDGRLVVVSFHSLEDRIVKRFIADRGGKAGRPSRHAPPAAASRAATFESLTRGAVSPSPAEVAANPRARSARLRAAIRTAAPVDGLLP